VLLKAEEKSKQKRKQRNLCFLFFALFRCGKVFASFEKYRNAPKGAKTYQSENNACNHVGGSRENPGYNIKIEKSDASPVQTADDQNNKGNSVKHCLNLSSINELGYKKEIIYPANIMISFV
jgi:hypothetical protein